MRSWKVRSTDTVLDVSSRLRVVRESVELPDGRLVGDYYQIALQSFVLVLAEARGGGIVCLEQYRHGPRRVVLGLPGGGIEPAEDELAAAQRELLEETGYVAENWQRIGRFHTLGNQGGSHCAVFRADSARAIAEPRSGDLEEGTLVRLDREALRQAVAAGHFGVAADLAAAGIWLSRPSRPGSDRVCIAGESNFE